ncbi:XdhC family protein [Altericista sp. CCNU0014]|uniref:XdhC family protein n=1 Tax=Altericista sp. CCNU0014 TaxID=3082949 RepID=UPI00384B8B58
MTIAFFQKLAQFLNQGAATLATVVDITGSVPREIGAKILVNDRGEVFDTIGGGAGEAKVIRHALEVLKTGDSQFVEIDLSGAAHRQVQGVCGGMMRVWLARWQGEAAIALVRETIETLQAGKSLTLVTPYDSGTVPYLLDHPVQADRLLENAFVELLHPAPILLIIGAGHCGIQLAKVAQLLDFQVMVQDDRPDWANPVRYPNVARIFTESAQDVIAQLGHWSHLYAALVTRGFQYDIQALRALLALPMPCHYIGMIGSQKRVQRVLKAIELELHLARARSQSPIIYAPIGLDIGALTPAEIAVSIAAELVMVRRGGSGYPLSVI